MAVTGQISIARVGRSVQIFEEETDINDVFDPNASPRLQAGDHVTLYPGDFRPPLRDESITVPSNVFVSILPGAKVEYDVINGPLAQRYENINGEIVNIADLNIADQYTTESETQSPRVRIYSKDSQTGQGVTVPFEGYNELDAAAENAESGDTIVVFPGTYTPQKNLFVNGATWHFFEGAIVEYRRKFQASEQYPHALFDDSHSVGGEVSTGGKNCDVSGSGEFRVGTKDEQPDLGSDSFPNDTFSQFDWQTWQMYSVVGVNSNSTINFEAKKIRMDNYADAAVKVSGGNVDVEVGEVEVKSTIEQEYGSGGGFPSTVSFPAFCLLNGKNGTINTEDVSIKVDEFKVEAKASSSQNSVPFFIGFNDDEERNNFTGNIDLSIGETNFEEPQTENHTVKLKNGAAPREMIIQDSEMLENSGGVAIAGSSQENPVTKLIIKNSNISTENSTKAPLRFNENGTKLDPHLDNSMFITGDTFEDPNSIRDETFNSDFEIKVYSSCFADKPVENFAEILHDELNGIQWTEDVQLLS